MRSAPVRWLGRSIRPWLTFFSVLIVLAGTLTGVIIHRLTTHQVRAVIADYHLMPDPAYRTTLDVRFSQPPERPSRRSRSLAGGRAALAPPLRECPHIGADGGCAELIDVTNGGHQVIADHAEGPYDGSAATLVGVLNSSSGEIRAVDIAANTGVFHFAGSGICDGRYTWSRHCRFGSTGYEGPGTSFSDIGPGGRSGVVSFSPPLAPGRSAYFSLAQALAADTIAGGAPSVAEQGGAPNQAERQVQCSAEPVNCATGRLWEQYTDFSLPGTGIPVVLARTYNSGRAAITSPFGHGWSFSYGMKLTFGPGGRVSVLQENGSSVAFWPNGREGYAAAPRVMAALSGNARAGYTFTRFGDQVSFHFLPSGRLASETDPDGDSTRLSYVGNHLIVTGASGRRLVFTFAGPYIHSVTDPMGHEEIYAYDAAGDLASVTDAAGREWRFTYQRHRLTRIVLTSRYISGGRIATTVRYEAAHRVRSVTSTDQGTTSWTYRGHSATPAGGVTIVTEPGRDRAVYEYSGLELTAVTLAAYSPIEATTSYTYSPAALVTTVTDPDLRVTDYGYDPTGDITTIVNPMGARTSYRYNRYGEVTWTKLPGQPPSRNAYDSHGNLRLSESPLGELTTYYLNPVDPSEVTASVSLAGRTDYSYDAQGDLATTSVLPRRGTVDTTSYAYNADGNVSCQITPGGFNAHLTCPQPGAPHRPGTTTYGYDGDGELTSVTDAAGHATSYAYDLDGDISKIIEPDRPKPTVVTYRYNTMGEQVSERRNGILIASATYDQRGDQLTQSDGAGHTTRYAYDLLGDVIKITEPMGQVTRYGYDHAGNKMFLVSASGRSTRYSYNAASELTAVSYGSARIPAISYRYYPDGLQRAATDSAGTSSYTYDGDQRLLKATFESADGGATSYEYRYDDRARTVTLIYPNGEPVVSQYDGAGQLTSVTDWLDHTIGFGYTPDGDLDRERLPGDVTTSYGATGITVARHRTTVATFSSTSDPTGRLASTAATGPGGIRASQASYRYTPTGELSAVGSQSFGYTGSGSLKSLPGGSQSFNRDGQLTASERSGTITRYRYDKDGDLASIAQGGTRPARLGYNQAGQLTSYRSNGTSIKYAYDGYGLRVSSTSNGQLTRYTWDRSQPTPVLLANGATSYIYGPNGQPVEQITGGTPSYLIADQQGSTRLLTNESGRITGAYSYSPYGTATHALAATTALQYGGQLTDAATGYVYLKARYYDPATGQFLTRDPASQLTGEPYAYAGDDPVNVTDPTGLFWNPFSWVSDVFSAVRTAVSAVVAGVSATISAVTSVVAGVTEGIASGAQLIATGVGYAWHVTIGEHWRGLLEAAVDIGAVGAALACIAITDGLCGYVIGIAGFDVEVGSLAVGAAIEGLRDGLNYLIGAGAKSAGGFFSAVGEGALGETGHVPSEVSRSESAPSPPAVPDLDDIG
jgi:RHS repeat-associated protein